MSELRPNPYPGEIWHHWMHRPDRPHTYRILTTTVADIGMDVTFLFECETAECFPKTHYTYRRLVLYSSPEIPGLCWLEYDDRRIEEPHVIFKQQDEIGSIWATQLDEFMAPNENSPTGWRFVRAPYNGL